MKRYIKENGVVKVATPDTLIKEEYGTFKGYQFCEDVADALEDGISAGRTQEDIEWSLNMYGYKSDIESADDFHSLALYNIILDEISFAVRDGNLHYDGIELILDSSENFDKKDVAYDLMRLFDVDDKEIRAFLTEPDYELSFYLDYSIDFDMDAFDRAYEEGEYEESLKEGVDEKSNEGPGILTKEFLLNENPEDVADAGLIDTVNAETTSTEVVPEGQPEPGPDNGIANLLITLINGEWDTIKDYNDFTATASAEGGYEDMLPVIADIVAEENVHIGQLQKLLQQISPDALKIAQGESEAEGQIGGELEPEKIDKEG